MSARPFHRTMRRVTVAALLVGLSGVVPAALAAGLREGFEAALQVVGNVGEALRRAS